MSIISGLVDTKPRERVSKTAQCVKNSFRNPAIYSKKIPNISTKENS